MVRCICFRFFNNALFLLGSWKILKTLSCSSVNSEWKIVQDHSKRWKCGWLMKENGKWKYYLNNMCWKIQDFWKNIALFIFEIFQLPKKLLIKPRTFSYSSWTGLLEKFFSITFQEDEIFQKQVGQSIFRYLSTQN